MNPIKSPHQLLLEEAGASLDPSPGLVNTPQQMLMQQANILPHLALGGAVTPADMQAALIVNGNTPQHFATGGHPESFLEKLKALLKHVPMPATLNVGLGLPGAYEEHENLQKNLQGGNYGSAANNALHLGASLSPYFLVPSMYDAGNYLSEASAGHLAHDPTYRQKMQDMSSTPMGGALAGDTGLASQILGQHEYDEPPSILAGTTLPKR